MDRPPTKEELLRFHGRDKKLKKKIVSCKLVDPFGNIHAQGSYALCKSEKQRLGGNLTIDVTREGDQPQIIIKNSPFK